MRIKLHTVGICGSDVHYYTHGGIGAFWCKAPMILGHEASGIVIETGAEVTTLKVGDRVCMEPGIPDPNSRATRLGMYNVDPAVRFWATPPIHGILRPTVVHPADFTFKLPDNVSFAEAAMVEPLAVGVHAATKAQIKPGDIGAGHRRRADRPRHRALGAGRRLRPGLRHRRRRRQAGARRDARADHPDQRRAARTWPRRSSTATDGWGVDIVFECSGNAARRRGRVRSALRPAAASSSSACQSEPIAYDVGKAMVREARVEHVFRYAHVFPRCVAMLSSGAIDVKPLITRTFGFDDSVDAFEIAASAPPGEVKMQIVLPQ